MYHPLARGCARQISSDSRNPLSLSRDGSSGLDRAGRRHGASLHSLRPLRLEGVEAAGPKGPLGQQLLHPRALAQPCGHLADVRTRSGIRRPSSWIERFGAEGLWRAAPPVLVPTEKTFRERKRLLQSLGIRDEGFQYFQLVGSLHRLVQSLLPF